MVHFMSFKQAMAAGIKKILVTDFIIQNWSTENIDTSDPDTAYIYQRCKIATDRKIWEIACKHQDIDIAVLLPPAVYSSLVPNYPLTSCGNLGMNDIVYQFLLSVPDMHPNIPFGHMVDVCDIAQAHVAALAAPPVLGCSKRFIVACGMFTWNALVELIRKKHPELTDRLLQEDAKIVPQYGCHRGSCRFLTEGQLEEA
ncbi:hypothetical protein D9758_011966 [Tetrapyrgos nigripes]|uniref:NAD-dependent epimerase/dehydratase domain-containing protein n=1 Tax=Tetrapyrgos nigripes TaxID=182062 RepID=A0A8H5D2J0_9AGAR|nr:hypothetical protein D9758_011966 [Tetrapyrgos nigripes]